MSMTVTYLEAIAVRALAEKAIEETGLPIPRAIGVSESKTYDDEDVFIINLLVQEGDELGTAEQRVKTAGRIQRSVWDGGDPRTIFLRHQLLETTSTTKTFN
jgi:hypothetical protein